MGAKEIAVRCPCCDSRLVVDVQGSRVLSWTPADKLDAAGKKDAEQGWTAAHERAKGKLGEGLDKFEAGLRREQQREKDLDDLWRKQGSGGDAAPG
jgi:hypothetical protein